MRKKLKCNLRNVPQVKFRKVHLPSSLQLARYEANCSGYHHVTLECLLTNYESCDNVYTAKDALQY